MAGMVTDFCLTPASLRPLAAQESSACTLRPGASLQLVVWTGSPKLGTVRSQEPKRSRYCNSLSCKFSLENTVSGLFVLNVTWGADEIHLVNLRPDTSSAVSLTYFNKSLALSGSRESTIGSFFFSVFKHLTTLTPTYLHIICFDSHNIVRWHEM